MAYEIPDAPWIEESMRTGHYKYGWWNTPDYETEDDEDEEDCCVEVDLI